MFIGLWLIDAISVRLVDKSSACWARVRKFNLICAAVNTYDAKLISHLVDDVFKLGCRDICVYSYKCQQTRRPFPPRVWETEFVQMKWTGSSVWKAAILFCSGQVCCNWLRRFISSSLVAPSDSKSIQGHCFSQGMFILDHAQITNQCRYGNL